MPLSRKKNQDLPDLKETFRSLLSLGEKILSPRSASTDTLSQKRPREDKPETLSYVNRYHFGSYYIDFVYSPGITPTTAAPSTLEARIFLDRSESLLFFMPYDILPHINPNDFLCRYFPYIESEERMRACYQTLAESLTAYRISFETIANDSELLRRSYDDLKDEITRAYGVNIFSPSERGTDYDNSLLTLRFHHIVKWKSTFYSSMDYNDFLLGDFTRAQGISYRHKVRPDYIDAMARFAAETQPFSYTAVPPEAASLSSMMEITRKSSSLPLLILSCVLSLPVFAAIYGLLYTLVSQAVAASAVFFTGATLSSLVNTVPFILVSAVAWAVTSSHIVMKLFMRRRYRAFKPYLRMIRENPVRPFAGGLKKLILLGSILLVTLSACRGIYFREDDMLNRSGFFPFSGDSYEYRDIASVTKYIRSDGTFFYLIEFPGGKFLDLSEIMGPFDYQAIDKKLAPLFAEHGLEAAEKEAPTDFSYLTPSTTEDTSTSTSPASTTTDTPSTLAQPESEQETTPTPAFGAEV